MGRKRQLCALTAGMDRSRYNDAEWWEPADKKYKTPTVTESRPVVAWDPGAQEEKEAWLTKRQEDISEGVGRVIPECGDGVTDVCAPQISSDAHFKYISLLYVN